MVVHTPRTHRNVRAIRATAVEILMARPLGASAQTVGDAPLVLNDLETEEGVNGPAYVFCCMRIVPGTVARMLADIEDAPGGERVAPVDLLVRLLRRLRLLGDWVSSDGARGFRRGVPGCTVPGGRIGARQLSRSAATAHRDVRQRWTGLGSAGAAGRRGRSASYSRMEGAAS